MEQEEAVRMDCSVQSDRELPCEEAYQFLIAFLVYAGLVLVYRMCHPEPRI